jgi:hypothetical protein
MFQYNAPDTSPILGGYRGEGMGTTGRNLNGWSFSDSFFSDPQFSPFQSKYNQVFQNESGGLTARFQQPGGDKYSLVDANYTLDPSSSRYTLQGASPFRQESSLSSGLRTAAMPAAFIGGAMLAPYLAGGLGSLGASSGIAGGSGFTAGSVAGLGGTGAGLSITPAMAAAITPSFAAAGGSVLGAAASRGLTNAALNAATGGDLESSLRAGAIGAVSGGAGQYLGNTFGPIAGQAGGSAVSTALQGGSFSDVLRNAGTSAGLSGLNSAGGSMFGNLSENPLFGSIQKFMGNNGPQIGTALEGLAGLYQGYQQRRMAKEFMSGYGTNRGSYETQLRNNLARRDAASGRRSDYAGRETQLQAALAELDSRNAPAMMQAQQAKMSGQLGMLQSLLRFGGKSGFFDRPQTMMPSLSSLGTNSFNYTNNNTDDFFLRNRLLGGGS